jgi:hypothetical protein
LITRVKDEEQVKVLGEAIAEDLIFSPLDNVYRQVKKAKIWQDPQKQKNS